jgi:hypothetical protein
MKRSQTWVSSGSPIRIRKKFQLPLWCCHQSLQTRLKKISRTERKSKRASLRCVNCHAPTACRHSTRCLPLLPTQHVAAGKTRYKWLDGGVHFIDAVPKNPSGKILVSALPPFVFVCKILIFFNLIPWNAETGPSGGCQGERIGRAW